MKYKYVYINKQNEIVNEEMHTTLNISKRTINKEKEDAIKVEIYKVRDDNDTYITTLCIQ